MNESQICIRCGRISHILGSCWICKGYICSDCCLRAQTVAAIYGGSWLCYDCINAAKKNMRLIAELKHVIEQLEHEIMVLQNKNVELELNPPIEGGELYLQAKEHFYNINNSQ